MCQVNTPTHLNLDTKNTKPTNSTTKTNGKQPLALVGGQRPAGTTEHSSPPHRGLELCPHSYALLRKEIIKIIEKKLVPALDTKIKKNEQRKNYGRVSLVGGSQLKCRRTGYSSQQAQLGKGGHHFYMMIALANASPDQRRDTSGNLLTGHGTGGRDSRAVSKGYR